MMGRQAGWEAVLYDARRLDGGLGANLIYVSVGMSAFLVSNLALSTFQ